MEIYLDELKQRARNAMIGLAMGDAVGWPAMFHRSFLLPPWIRRIMREMETASETTNVILRPTPFSLNQPSHLCDIAPTDDSEWAAFTAASLVRRGTAFDTTTIAQEWMSLVNSGERIRGSVATQAALRNLAKGIMPPQSGKENPHYFDGGAMARAVPIGIYYARDPAEAARVASMDASVTSSEDGVWAAQAMAAAISAACSAAATDEVVRVAYQFLPVDSWIRATVDEPLALAATSDSLFQLLPEFHRRVVNREYSYGNAAPEILALTLAIPRSIGHDFERAITTAGMFAKSADGLPACVGALVGAMHPEPIAGEGWLQAVTTLKGICIPSLAGVNYLQLSEQLVDAAVNRKGGAE